jgi:hypothetical protein
MHTHAHADTYTHHMHTCMHTSFMHVYTYARMQHLHACTHAHMHTWIYAHIHVCPLSHTCTHKHACTLAFTHAHMLGHRLQSLYIYQTLTTNHFVLWFYGNCVGLDYSILYTAFHMGIINVIFWSGFINSICKLTYWSYRVELFMSNSFKKCGTVIQTHHIYILRLICSSQ